MRVYTTLDEIDAFLRGDGECDSIGDLGSEDESPITCLEVLV
jgi:hypothetical protein